MMRHMFMIGVLSVVALVLLGISYKIAFVMLAAAGLTMVVTLVTVVYYSILMVIAISQDAPYEDAEAEADKRYMGL